MNEIGWPTIDSKHLIVNSKQMMALEKEMFSDGMPQEALMEKAGIQISKWLFQLLIALRFIPLVQEEFQNIIKSVTVRSINLRNLGLKKSFNILLILVERLFQNIFLRIDQGAESLLSKKKIIIKTNRFRTFYPSKSIYVIVNTLSICFICIAIFLRKLYGAL